MPNMEATNLGTRSVRMGNNDFRTVTFDFAAAETWPEGMILADNVAGTKVVEYVQGAGDATGVAKYILSCDLTADAIGDVFDRAMISGRIDETMLSIKGGATVGLAEINGLREIGFVPVHNDEYGKTDNQ